MTISFRTPGKAVQRKFQEEDRGASCYIYTRVVGQNLLYILKVQK